MFSVLNMSLPQLTQMDVRTAAKREGIGQEDAQATVTVAPRSQMRDAPDFMDAWFSAEEGAGGASGSIDVVATSPARPALTPQTQLFANGSSSFVCHSNKWRFPISHNRGWQLPSSH